MYLISDLEQKRLYYREIDRKLQSNGRADSRLAVQLLLKISKLISARLRQTSGKLVDFLQD